MTCLFEEDRQSWAAWRTGGGVRTAESGCRCRRAGADRMPGRRSGGGRLRCRARAGDRTRLRLQETGGYTIPCDTREKRGARMCVDGWRACRKRADASDRGEGTEALALPVALHGHAIQAARAARRNMGARLPQAQRVARRTVAADAQQWHWAPLLPRSAECQGARATQRPVGAGGRCGPPWRRRVPRRVAAFRTCILSQPLCPTRISKTRPGLRGRRVSRGGRGGEPEAAAVTPSQVRVPPFPLVPPSPLVLHIARNPLHPGFVPTFLVGYELCSNSVAECCRCQNLSPVRGDPAPRGFCSRPALTKDGPVVRCHPSPTPVARHRAGGHHEHDPSPSRLQTAIGPGTAPNEDLTVNSSRAGLRV